MAQPRQGRINCTWILTLSRDALVEKVGALGSAKLNEVENLILMSEQM